MKRQVPFLSSTIANKHSLWRCIWLATTALTCTSIASTRFSSVIVWPCNPLFWLTNCCTTRNHSTQDVFSRCSPGLIEESTCCNWSLCYDIICLDLLSCRSCTRLKAEQLELFHVDIDVAVTVVRPVSPVIGRLHTLEQLHTTLQVTMLNVVERDNELWRLLSLLVGASM